VTTQLQLTNISYHIYQIRYPNHIHYVLLLYTDKVPVCFDIDTYCNIESPFIILGKWPTWRTILFYVFIYIFNSLHVSSTSC